MRTVILKPIKARSYSYLVSEPWHAALLLHSIIPFSRRHHTTSSEQKILRSCCGKKELTKSVRDKTYTASLTEYTNRKLLLICPSCWEGVRSVEGWLRRLKVAIDLLFVLTQVETVAVADDKAW